MNTNPKRMVLAAIAAFYVVVGGMWGTHYFPYKNFEAQIERQNKLVEKMGFTEARASKAYKKAGASIEHYARTSPSLGETLSKIDFYQSILMWGTIALGAGGSVLLLTRGRKSQPAQTGAQ